DNRKTFSYTAIFQGRLAWITPMFWLSNAINLMIFYFVNQWVPTLLTTNGILTRDDAALAITAFQFAGTLGGLTIMRPLDKYGFIPVPILFLLAVPIVAAIGLPGHPKASPLPWSQRRASACSDCSSATSRPRAICFRPMSAPGASAPAL